MRRQFLGLTLARYAAAGAAAVWLGIAARLLPVSEFGDLSLLLSVGAVFGIIADLGISLVLTQVTAEASAIPVGSMWHAVRKRAVAAAIASVGVSAAYLTVAADRNIAVPLIFAVSMIATTVYSSITAARRGLGLVSLEAWNEFISRLCVLGAGTLVLAAGGGLVGAVAVYAGADFVSAVIIGMRGYTGLPVGPDVDRRLFGLRAVVPLSAAALLGSLYFRIDVWLIALFRDSSVVAFYSASYRLVDGLILPAAALSAFAIAHATRTVVTPAPPRQTVRLALLAGAVLVVPAAAVAVFASRILGAVFGSSYANADDLLVVLVISAPLTATSTVLLPLAATRDRRRFARAFGLALAVNVALNVAGIPRFGAIAAAWATVISQALLTSALYRISMRPTRPQIPEPVGSASRPEIT